MGDQRRADRGSGLQAEQDLVQEIPDRRISHALSLQKRPSHRRVQRSTHRQRHLSVRQREDQVREMTTTPETARRERRGNEEKDINRVTEISEGDLGTKEMFISITFLNYKRRNFTLFLTKQYYKGLSR